MEKEKGVPELMGRREKPSFYREYKKKKLKI